MKPLHEIFLMLNSADEEGELVLRADRFFSAKRIQRNGQWLTEINGGQDCLYVRQPPELIADMIKEQRQE